jgi:hypothetical protein
MLSLTNRPKESTKKKRDATADVVSRVYTVNLHKRIHGVYVPCSLSSAICSSFFFDALC